MSMQVDRFLSDSGGNFTESAPRPPVPGEENELQSNGGTSTRSSSSHKSQLSSKSHTSSGKSGRSDNHHSPAATPRRSNLDKSHHLASHEVSCKEDMEAPLGFEPEGSAASSPPFNENSPPPYLKWAENIESLFEDLEGVRLFKKFLDQESSSNPLDFWFACKGLQEGVQPDEEEKLQSLVKLIYKRYIRGDHLQLPTDMKKSITTKFKKQSYNQGIFKEAQMLIQSRMSNDTYPLFLKSDIYVQYVQQGGESPKTISNTSSGSNSARPLSGPLPTVHEGEELREEDIKSVSSTIVGAHSGSSVTSTANTTILPLTQDTLNITYSVRGAASTKFAIPEGFPKYSYHQVNRLNRLTQPEHLSYVPVSQWESEVQSLSSDALTESDTMSLTDSSVDGRDVRRGSRHWKLKQRRIKVNAQQNKHTGLTIPLIPRTERALKDRNIAETDPAKFAAMLIEKLEQVKAKLEEPERMRELLNTVEICDSPPPVAASSSSSKQQQQANMSMNTSTQLNTSGVLVNSFNASSMNNSLSFFMNSMVGPEEDNAQSILEDHVSRIWDESTGQTPANLTPGRHSPDRLDRVRGSRGHGHGHKQRQPQTPALPSGSSSSRDHMMSLQSFDSGVCGEVDAASAGAAVVAAAAAASTSSSDSHHKHIHHYHHHHHHIHKDNKGVGGSLRTSSAGGVVSSAGMHHMMSAPTLYTTAKDGSTGSGNKRVPPLPPSAVAVSSGKQRVLPDNNSNVDSGIYDLPNMRDPANEKVMAWMIENDKLSTGPTQYSTDNSDKGSSHKRSHKSGSSLHKSKKQGAFESSRSTSLDRSLPLHHSASAPQTFSSVQPSQPIVQDPSMPLLTPAKTTVQLEEVRRRLLSDHSSAGDQQQQVQQQRSSAAAMAKSKSFSHSMSASSSTPLKPRGSMPPPPPRHHHGHGPPGGHQSRSMHLPPPQSAPLDLSSGDEQHNYSFSRSRSSSRRQPAHAPSHSVPATPTSAPSSSTPDVTVVGYYFCSEPIPYRSTLHGSHITLAQFKELLTKKGNYRYFFKKASDEFDSGVVYEEVCRDQDVLPLCDGKIIGKVDKVE